MVKDNIEFPDLDRLFNPKSVLLVGASDRPGSIGRIALENISEHSAFDGPLYLVNPSRDEVAGLPCHRTISDLPTSGIDVALLVTPAATTLDVLQACADKGVRHAIIITSGFGETDGGGKDVEARMRSICRQSGIRIYGPNCPGLTNVNARIGLNISPSFRNDLKGGPIGLVTQGGGMGRAVMQGAVRGPGVGLWGSAGNEVDLDAADLIHHMVADPGIEVVTAVIEGFRSGPRFVAAAQAAANTGKPIILLKVGRSDYGAMAAQSHTAAIAGQDEINDAVFHKYGAIRVDDLDELHETATLMLRGKSSAARSVCVFGFSGGACGFAADMIGDRNLHMADFGPELSAAIKSIAPSYAAISNPVDLTTQIFSEEDLHRRALETVSAAEEIDVVVMPIPGEYGRITEKLAQDIVHVAAKEGGALLVPVWMTEKNGSGNEILVDGGVPPFRSMGKAADALKRLNRYRIWTKLQTRPMLRAGRQVGTASNLPAKTMLNEIEAKNLLAETGLRMPVEVLARTGAEAEAAARKIGGKVALKIVSADIAHKTDVGGVALSVPQSEVTADFAAMMERVRSAMPEAVIDGILVCEMIENVAELLVGIHHDEVFGPILTIGAGGALVELLREVRHIPLPLHKEEVARALDTSRLGRLLAGRRGAPAADKAALVSAIEGVCGWFDAHADRVVEFEINPMAVLPEGRGVVALDVFVRLTEPSGAPEPVRG